MASVTGSRRMSSGVGIVFPEVLWKSAMVGRRLVKD
jgi:hypothetical protein